MRRFKRPNGPIALALSLAAALLATATAGQARDAAEEALPRFFVRLSAVDPTILQDIRYATSLNFIGRPIDGYEKGDCILTNPLAKALKAAQAELAAEGLSFIVYDCYRPARAVAEFNAWLDRPGETEMKTLFFPDLDKAGIRDGRFIAKRSRHSRGGAVDLAIIRPPFSVADPDAADRAARCDGPFEDRHPDTNLDFGTGFDCFSALSHTASPNVTPEAQRWRQRLVALMARHGFRNYRREWWHFDFIDEVYRRRQFDFPVR